MVGISLYEATNNRNLDLFRMPSFGVIVGAMKIELSDYMRSCGPFKSNNYLVISY